MQGSYDPKDVVVVIRTSDAVEGADFSEKVVVGFADRCIAESVSLLESLDFDKVLEKRGVGTLYAVTRKPEESDEELKQRIIETKKGFI